MARGPDNEPLLVSPEPVALLDDAVVKEARAIYDANFSVGRQSTDGDLSA